MVEFNENLTNTPLGLQIGSVEADILYIADNGELCVNEFGASHHLLWKCAKNGDAFLDALLVAACFLNDFSRDDEDMELCLESVKRCASAAGGERYLNFYLMLLGYDD